MEFDICSQYLHALNEGDLVAVLSLFEDATVFSPLYGVMDVEPFYRSLFGDTHQSNTRLIEIFEPKSGKSTLALNFKYEWTLRNGTVVEFNCVDIFELNSAKSKFEKLTIIYDTSPFREVFNNL